MNYKTVKIIEVSDWNKLVQETYGRPYNFQQQEGCQDRGIHYFTVPNDETYDEEMNDEIPEIVNHEEMGVKFNVWLERDPNQQIPNSSTWSTKLWWERNFYPDLQTVVNDLYSKGLIEAGDYAINIDW